MTRRRWMIAGLVTLMLIGAVGPVVADWKPSKPVTVIVPWPAGGATDLTVRILSSEMEKVLGQRISVVNTPADMIRAKKLKPLANTSNRTLTITGFGEIPPITKWYPTFPSTGSHFGLMVPKEVPKDVVAAISRAFDAAAKSDALKKFADEKAVFLTNLKEAEALAMAEETASVTTWTLFDNGAAKISPAQFNIAKPKR